jgi:FkbM family methyltransferase
MNAPDAIIRAVDIDGITVLTLADNADAAWYQQRKVYEEKISPLYDFVREEGFTRFVDIGANSGYISMLVRRAAPHIDLVSLEADPRLVAMLREGFERNALDAPAVINAIVGECDLPCATFSLNPGGTLDNRVNMPQWPQIQVPVRSVDSVLASRPPASHTFFKIDTQGYEQHVLRGMRESLAGTGWMLKMEFAPAWLRSQGTDPLALLDQLQAYGEFAEFPERIPFGTRNLDDLFAYPIRSQDHDRFLEYVMALNRAGRGWVDLIARPRSTTSPQQAHR